MSRLISVPTKSATGELKQLYGTVGGLLGGVPELFQAVGNSTPALTGLLGVLGALSTGSLTAKEREAVALVVSEFNSCSYCLSAHTALGLAAGMPQSETCDVRWGQIQEPKIKSLVQFVAAVLETKGDITGAQLKAVKTAGYEDKENTEILLTIAVNYFTNIFNQVNQTKVDFPVVIPGQKVNV
jgi:AhpD family alkylhydroperoxidase